MKIRKASPILACVLALFLSSCVGLSPWGHHSHWPKPEPGPVSPGRSTSIFVSTDRHGGADGNNFTAVLKAAVAGSEVTPGVVLIAGDLVGHGQDRTPSFSVADIYNEMDSVLDIRTHELLLTYASHDAKCTDGYSAFLSGPHRCDGYYVYGLPFAQMTFATDKEAQEAIDLAKKDSTGENRHAYRGLDASDRLGISAESGSESFLRWVSSLDDEAPILVASHVPLHVNRRDNVGAQTWFDALTQAARYHDVIFLWGHNHTLEEQGSRPPRNGEQQSQRNPLLDRDYYLLLPGDDMKVQSAVDSIGVDKRLTFTYVNAGYLKLGYGTVITFSDSRQRGRYDRMRIQRFSINENDTLAGVFGNTGRKNPYETSLSGASLYVRERN